MADLTDGVKGLSKTGGESGVSCGDYWRLTMVPNEKDDRQFLATLLQLSIPEPEESQSCDKGAEKITNLE